MDLYLVYTLIGIVVVGLVLICIILDVDCYAGRLYKKISDFMRNDKKDN